jgi:hypothetical protein
MPGVIHAGMTPLLPLIAGLVALAAGALVLRSFGARYRVGRLLASTPAVSVDEARALSTGPARYVRVAGRIDAEDEFEDDAHRPLVFRRSRLSVFIDGGWVDVEDDQRAVRFGVQEGRDRIGVDHTALDAGLTVVPRESLGTAADVPDRVPADTPPGSPVRLRIEQVSSVEHAIVLGVPRPGPDGDPLLTAGLGRPLVLTTLEVPDAMRILADGRPIRPRVAAFAFGGGSILIVIGLVWALAEAIG